MAKAKTQFVCQQCNFTSSRWYGRCPECQSWSSLVEEVEEGSSSSMSERSYYKGEGPVLLSSNNEEEVIRIPIPLKEVHRVLGEGLTLGSVVLLGGDPGIGKSTLLLQLFGKLSQTSGPPLLYVSGEESPQQIRLRAQRLGLEGDRIHLLAETNVVQILDVIEKMKPQIVGIDSIQTLYLPDLSSIPGSISQVREAADRLVRLAKRFHITIFLIGHVTKEGNLAGPMTLEHLVDTVLHVEGDRSQNFRILRVQKNRFGPTDEIGVLEMTDKGLREIQNPSELFLRDRPIDTPGTVVFPAMEGSRPLLVEIQGLTSRSSYGVPMRNTVGFDKNRLTMLLAVLEKRGGLEISGEDVYVNVVGGLRITEPAADLAVIFAVVSSFLGRPFPPKTVVFGEMGLAGEIRKISKTEARFKEASKLGFQSAICPKDYKSKTDLLECSFIGSVKDVVKTLM